MNDDVPDLPTRQYEKLGKLLHEDDFDVFVAFMDGLHENTRRQARGLPIIPLVEVLEQYEIRRGWPPMKARGLYSRMRAYGPIRQLSLPPLREGDL